jgi:hypothetical protein
MGDARVIPHYHYAPDGNYGAGEAMLNIVGFAWGMSRNASKFCAYACPETPRERDDPQLDRVPIQRTDFFFVAAATKKRLPENAKDLGVDKPHGRATTTLRTRNRNSL